MCREVVKKVDDVSNGAYPAFGSSGCSYGGSGIPYRGLPCSRSRCFRPSRFHVLDLGLAVVGPMLVPLPPLAFSSLFQPRPAVGECAIHGPQLLRTVTVDRDPKKKRDVIKKVKYSKSSTLLQCPAIC